ATAKSGAGSPVAWGPRVTARAGRRALPARGPGAHADGMGTILGATTRRTTVETFLSRARSLGERPFLHFHQDGDWRCLTWAEAGQRVLRVAAALVAEGVRPGDRIVLISENRFEWILADFGIQAAAAVTVPVFPSLLPSTVRAMVEDSGAILGIAGSEELGARLLGPRAMRRVVVF